MLRMKCQYRHDTGFKDGQSWRDGELLQFVAAFDGDVNIWAIVLPAGAHRPVTVEIRDLLFPTPQESER